MKLLSSNSPKARGEEEVSTSRLRQGSAMWIYSGRYGKKGQDRTGYQENGTATSRSYISERKARCLLGREPACEIDEEGQTEPVGEGWV